MHGQLSDGHMATCMESSIERALHGVVESVLSKFIKRNCSSESKEDDYDLRPLRKTRFTFSPDV